MDVNNILAHILKCGNGDVDFIARQFDEYDVDVDAVMEAAENLRTKVWRKEWSYEVILEKIWHLATIDVVDDYNDDNGTDFDGTEVFYFHFVPYWNYLDSHFKLFSEEIYDRQTLSDVIKRHLDNGDQWQSREEE